MLGDRPAARKRRRCCPRPSSCDGDPRRADSARARAAAGSCSRRRSPPNTTCTSARRSRCPHPIPMTLRVAALSTNIGWAPGAIVMNAADYARAWGSEDASAYNVLLEPRRPTGAGRTRDPAAPWARTRALRCRPPHEHARAPERAQPPGARAPDADRDADPDRRGARDGRGDGRDDLAAPPAPGQAQARGARRARICGTRSCSRASCCSASAA